MHYSGFWSRAVANWIDGFVFLPLGALYLWLFSLSRPTAMLVVVAAPCVANLYTILLHRRYGQTLGKMVARIKVTRLDGSPIAMREALLRSSVDVSFGVVWIAVSVYVLATWTGEWSQLPFLDRNRLFDSRNPLQPWYSYVSNGWYWSELIVLLLNKKRRALHDYIAETVVLNLRPAPPGYWTNWPLPDLAKPPSMFSWRYWNQPL